MANDLTSHFMAALHLSEQNRLVKGVALGVTTLLGVGVIAWVFRDRVKTTTVEQVADVAKRSLADVDVQGKVQEMSQEVIQRILTDPSVLSAALQFTTRLLKEPSTQTALSNLLHAVLQEPQTLERAHTFSTSLVQSLTQSPAVQRMTAELVRGAIEQPSNRAQLIALLHQTVNDERSLSELRRVGSASAHDVLNDVGVQQHMTAFMKGVLSDPSLQHTAGDALWSAVRYSFRPKWGNNGGKVDLGQPPPPPPLSSPPSPPSPLTPLTASSSSSAASAPPPSSPLLSSPVGFAVASVDEEGWNGMRREELDEAVESLQDLTPTYTITVTHPPHQQQQQPYQS